MQPIISQEYNNIIKIILNQLIIIYSLKNCFINMTELMSKTKTQKSDALQFFKQNGWEVPFPAFQKVYLETQISYHQI
jgi:hypothetical protein